MSGAWLDECKLVKVHCSSWGISKMGSEVPLPGISAPPISASRKFLKTFHPPILIPHNGFQKYS